MYICTISEHDEAQGWVCPMQDPNEPVERCEDCAFWRWQDDDG